MDKRHQNEQLFKKFIGIEDVFYFYYLFGERQGNVIEAEGLSLAAKDVPGELITQYYSCELALMILFPMLESTLTYFEQILLEKLRDFTICFFAGTEPAFHHLRWHFGISVPAVEVQVVGHLKRIF